MSLPDYVIKEASLCHKMRKEEVERVPLFCWFSSKNKRNCLIGLKTRDLHSPASYPGLTKKTRRLRVVEKCCSKLVPARTQASFVLWARSHTDSPHLWRPKLNFHSSCILARFPRDSCYFSMTFPLKEVMETYSILVSQSPSVTIIWTLILILPLTGFQCGV